MSKEVKVYKDTMGDCWYHVDSKYFPVAAKLPDRHFAELALFGILDTCSERLLAVNMKVCFPNGLESAYLTSFIFEGEEQ